MSESKKSWRRLAVVLAAIGIPCTGAVHLANKHTEEAQKRYDARQVYQVNFASNHSNKKILSINFTTKEGDELEMLLSDEKAMARIFVKRLAEIMLDSTHMTSGEMLQQALKDTFKADDGNNKDMDGVLRTYQLFKRAMVRETDNIINSKPLFNDSQKPVKVAVVQTSNTTTAQSTRSAAQVMLHKRTKGIG